MKTIGYAAHDTSGHLDPFHFDRRELRPNDVAIEILYSGVCHSDLHTARNDWGWTTYPTVVGHEIVGRVIEVAADVTKHKVGVPVLLLDHQPREARQAAAAGVALQLSGHTHGGMIAGLDRLVAPANNGFVSGRYEVGAMTLYVSNGTALWPGFALRLGRPSELTRITLRAQR